MGFCNFWGVTPAYNVLQNQNRNDLLNRSLNILLSNSNDIRHILKTISNTLEQFNELQKESSINLHFYLFESFKENLARCILNFHILNDRSLAIRDRIEIFMEIYGNTLLSSRTADYVNSNYKELIRFVSGDSKYSGCLNELIDLSMLSYKEKDEIIEVFQSYDLKYQYDIEKYRDDRLRYHYKERYEFRDNISDWDYHMNMKNFAPIVRLRHYNDFRRSGVSFEMRINKYNIPNRTLSSYIPGREVNY
jgi:dynein assembly factor 3